VSAVREPPEERPATPPATGDVPAGRHPASPPSEGDAAFIGFYRDQIRGLVVFLRCMGATLPDAADLAQETMIDAYRSWPSIARPHAWTRAVASRKFGRRSLAVAEHATDFPDGSPLLRREHDIAEWEQRNEIIRLLAGLPWRQRQVMAWWFDGYQPHEIAAELKISAEAVRSSLRLARRALAAALDDGGRAHDE
jgi:RNA polymerase sigma factor (sigma-70 family)